MFHKDKKRIQQQSSEKKNVQSERRETETSLENESIWNVKTTFDWGRIFSFEILMDTFVEKSLPQIFNRLGYRIILPFLPLLEFFCVSFILLDCCTKQEEKKGIA